MKELKNYKQIITEDGSITLFSEIYGESCHSTSGAETETDLHYISGCNIPAISKQLDSINILEVGFGLGIGLKQTLKTTIPNSCFLNFISFEIDSDLIEATLDELKYEYTKNSHCYVVKNDELNLLVFYGNARASIDTIPKYFDEKFHAIYQDAFSPKRNAILWTTEWFKLLKSLADKECILSTYSSSSSIRKSLLAANWFVTKGDKFGPKRSSTRANLIGPSHSDILEHLKRSPAIEITDSNYKTYTL